ncbi:hypothetical protein QTP88_009186 [Uroleucon formosanum]
MTIQNLKSSLANLTECVKLNIRNSCVGRVSKKSGDRGLHTTIKTVTTTISRLLTTTVFSYSAELRLLKTTKVVVVHLYYSGSGRNRGGCIVTVVVVVVLVVVVVVHSLTMGRKIKISCCGAPRRRGSCKSFEGIPGEVGRGGLDVK